MNTVFVIWNEIPENTTVYRLQLTDAEVAEYKDVSGRYINACDDDISEKIHQLSQKFTDDTKIFDEDKGMMPSIFVPADSRLIITGFVL